MYRCADVWMDGWLDGWLAGCMDGWLAGWMDGWMKLYATVCNRMQLYVAVYGCNYLTIYLSIYLSIYLYYVCNAMQCMHVFSISISFTIRVIPTAARLRRPRERRGKMPAMPRRRRSGACPWNANAPGGPSVRGAAHG